MKITIESVGDFADGQVRVRMEGGSAAEYMAALIQTADETVHENLGLRLADVLRSYEDFKKILGVLGGVTNG